MYFIVGCTYYKVTIADSIDPDTENIQNNSRYFIVHHGSNAWHFTNIALDDHKERLTGRLEALPENHKYYLTTKPDRSNRIKAKSAAGTNQRLMTNNPTYEVHFYVSGYQEDQSGQIIIPLTSVTKVEIYDKDEASNAVAYVLPIIGIAAIIAAVASADLSFSPW